MEFIEFDEFKKIDLRIGKILEAEKVEKSDKLLKFLVDLGEEKRVIVSGVAEHYSPEEMLEKDVVVILNLKPRTIFGIESQGMILFANNSKPIILKPEEEVAPGSIIS
jgi:methionine--tRNA ligase beta chain